MRILFLNQFYPPDVAATGQLLGDVAAALAGRGHEVHVVCSRRGYGGGPGRQAAEEVAAGVRVHRVSASGFGRSRLVGRAADYLSFHALAAWRGLRLPRMDLCVALTSPPLIGLVAAALARRRGTPLAVWSMDLYPEMLAALGVMDRSGLPYRILARASRGLYRRARVVISLGEVMSERLAAAGADPERIVTVHNWAPGDFGPPISRARSLARARWGLDGAVALMHAGNLGLGGDLETVLAAVGLLTSRPSAPDVRMLFVGDGKMREPLRRMAARAGLKCVAFHPPQPLDRLADTLAAGDIHLVSQRAGTQGLIVPSKLYGVMAAGRAVVFIGPEDCEAARMVTRSGAGLVAGSGDVAAAAAAIARLARDAGLRDRMGKAARGFYERQLGRERSVARIAEALLGAASTPVRR